ncbi:MAG: class I SAM-dependent methyltransferase [Phycisphaeraceae bacterium]|nr:MAG: class I SAM-dependent methyltransferase [Phycisphaeraceae bacterium]
MNRTPSSPRHASTLRREVARSVDAPASLLPVFNLLFKDMPSLGSSPRIVVNMLQRAGIGPRSRILDLACGKGTNAISAARRLRCSVVAVDACEAFIHEALAAAARANLTTRATFIHDDARAFAHHSNRKHRPFDAALMLGLWGIVEARSALRPLVKPGGIYIIDDAFRDERLTRRAPEFHEIPTRDESRALLEQRGDRVLELHIPTPSHTRALNAALYRKLAANASAIARDRPSLRPALSTFLDNQRHANRLLGKQLRPAIWVVQRAGFKKY